nr:recombinase family protein [uncultured Bacteroides sp.]
MKKKTALYCRVSSSQQTTDRQSIELLDFANNNNIQIDNDMIFKDIISGYSTFEERIAYNELLNKVNNGEICTILFSEFTRCSRNATELQQQIKDFQKKGVDLYFQKQNIWVRANTVDIGTQILIAVLSVVASYEVELFAERSIGGRIIKTKKGGHTGGFAPYGYDNVNKQLVINEEEAEVIRIIYKMYSEKKASPFICDYLNSKKIPSPYSARITTKQNERLENEEEEKEYKKYSENLKWRESSLNRLVKNTIYIGKRNFKFHEPEPSNKLPYNKRENRQILDEFEFVDEKLRIVTDELFNEVNELIYSRRCNKNLGIKHDNFVKHLLKCGHCGGNFGVGKNVPSVLENVARTYKCYNSISRKNKPKTCFVGGEMRQTKLDGLVLQLSLKMFAEINIENTTTNRIEANKKELVNFEHLLQNKESEFEQITNTYKRTVKRLLSVIDSDEEFSELIMEHKNKYDTEKNKLVNDIESTKKEIVKIKNVIKSLQNLSNSNNSSNYFKKQDVIRRDKELIREMVNEYISDIIVYKANSVWNIIVVKYTNGVELWGTVKSARYKNNELFYDEIFCKYGIEFQSWYIDNSLQSFNFNTENQTITYNGNDEQYKFDSGTYTFEQLNDILKNSDNYISFPLFEFESL